MFLNGVRLNPKLLTIGEYVKLHQSTLRKVDMSLKHCIDLTSDGNTLRNQRTINANLWWLFRLTMEKIPKRTFVGITELDRYYTVASIAALIFYLF